MAEYQKLRKETAARVLQHHFRTRREQRLPADEREKREVAVGLIGKYARGRITRVLLGRLLNLQRQSAQNVERRRITLRAAMQFQRVTRGHLARKRQLNATGQPPPRELPRTAAGLSELKAEVEQQRLMLEQARGV